MRRAEDAGVEALVVTVDSPVLGRRERDDAHDFHDLPPGMRCENLRDLRDGEHRSRPADPDVARSCPGTTSTGCGRSRTLPSLLKGVLHPEDARTRGRTRR